MSMRAQCHKYYWIVLVLCGFLSAQSQQTSRAVRHHTIAEPDVSPVSALLDKAEALLAKGDYSGADVLLKEATQKDTKSYQGWYDLGYAEQELNHPSEAIAAYRQSIGINPKIFESNLNLGLVLASAGQRDEALKYLKMATTLQPSSNPEQAKEHAWLALGKLELTSDPVAAEQSLKEATKLAPGDGEPHLLLAEIYESSNKLDLAKAQYQQALAGAKDTIRAEALRGLVNIAIASNQYVDAESNVKQYLAVAPSDSQAHLLLGRLLAAQGKNDDALTELNAAGNQGNPAVLEQKANLLTALHRDPEALPIYKQLVEQNPGDAKLHDQYGVALMHQRQFAPAEEQFLTAVKLSPNMANAYGDLAVAASENQQYDLTLKALEIRTKLLGDNPGTYFLRATALDHLRRFPEATQNYRQFLASSGVKYPDEEWKARHRLLAIQNMK